MRGESNGHRFSPIVGARVENSAASLAVLIIIVQALGLRAVRPQEPTQPRLDEEIIKQDKIYQSRGADIPRGYVTGRGLSDYAELLPTGFCDALAKLGSSECWRSRGWWS